MNDDEHDLGDDPAGDAAIEWWVRLRAGALTREEKAAFDLWLASDPAHRVAFDEVSRMSGKLADLRPSPQPKRFTPVSLRFWLAGVGALAAASIALYADFDDLTAYLRADYYTGTRAPQLVTLDDGSHIELDAHSAIKVNYGSDERRLTLIEGEAWFEVAPNPTRPFIVEAAGGTVTALGTAFDIALEKSDGIARVTVTEHRVNISSGGKDVVVEEGETSSFSRSATTEAPLRVDVEIATAWRRGLLIVEKRPLSDVLAALGRYHHGFIACMSAEVCSRRVSGVFGTDDPFQALREIESSLGLHMLRLTSYLVLLYG
ncbi:MAG TPA: FecR family protein [Methylocella sp.]|nr:FecR family protein [Methylocella sp.]